MGIKKLTVSRYNSSGYDTRAKRAMFIWKFHTHCKLLDCKEMYYFSTSKVLRINY